jgi:hypothetical protein
VLVEQPVNSGPNKFTDHVRNYTANSQLLSLANQSQQRVFVATALTSNANAKIPSLFFEPFDGWRSPRPFHPYLHGH